MMIFGDDSLAASIRPDKAKRNIQEAKQYFRNDVSSIAKIISAYYPLEILKMAAWEERRVHLSAKNELSVFEASFLPLIPSPSSSPLSFSPTGAFLPTGM